MTHDPRRGDAKPQNAEGTKAFDDDIEIIGMEAVDPDAPPPSGDAGGEDDDRESDQERESEVPEDAAASAEETGGEARIAALENDLLRVRADFENFRKRQQREVGEIRAFAASALVQQLLPVVDNFKRAMQAGQDGEIDAGFHEGITMIFKQLMETLEKEGLEPIATEGEEFDPNLHEAVAREETREAAANTITAELEPGYCFRSRLLKAARVRVAVEPAETD